MKILIVEPGKRPRRAEIDGSLQSMQKIVGGYIQAVYPWREDLVALVCDEDGLYKDTEWNRKISDHLVIKGTFFLCGISAEDFTDLPDDLMAKYSRLFRYPQFFVEA